jgi:hypothetical protein
MADLQERLLRASAVARLDEIVQALKSSRAALSAAHRQWLGELLVPLATRVAPQCLTAPGRGPRRDALITVLKESDDLRQSLGRLIELHTALDKSEPLESELHEFALQIGAMALQHDRSGRS